MKMGVIFPQSDVEFDASQVRDYVQAVEGMGFDHLLFYDHVLGAGLENRPNWTGFHKSDDRFHEVFVLLGYVAAVTQRIELSTGVLCLPQRQTALVAKQAAEVDVLSNGRFRLGVGIGWNDVEYEALGQQFEGRADRMEEQIALLRALWTAPIVDFHGEYHDVSDAGINPLPIQRPIPIWYGSRTAKALPRVARLADGWLPELRDPERVAPLAEKLRELMVANGRDPSSLEWEGRLSVKDGDPDLWRARFQTWADLGCTHFAVSTIWSGAESPDAHLELLSRFRDEVGVP